MQNAFIESFNGRLRDELLNETLFASLAQARVALGCWRADYNGSRPHSQLWMEDACRVRLHPPKPTNPTVRANSELDKTWGQRHSR
jgi:putative transposase